MCDIHVIIKLKAFLKRFIKFGLKQILNLLFIFRIVPPLKMPWNPFENRVTKETMSAW